MQEGDVLLLYTDGITESRNGAGELFGLGRLCSILNARCAEPPQTIIDAVLQEVSAFTGTTAKEDDVTMIVMKVV
jgi:sigma-B regulation protein RsbU (phosphoserine phosphatase)